MTAATLLGGRYALGDPIAAGGMGEVFMAHDQRDGQVVAVKRLRAALAAQSEGAERFVREGALLRAAAHPNIVAVLGVVDDPTGPYIIMEYVPGGTLEQVLEREGPLPIERALGLAIDLADALARAHRLGVIHRDLKPANVLLAADGTPRLTDFGIASMRGEQPLTGPGVVIGTLPYLAPESWDGEEPDARSDIWALGVLLYESISGRRPFAGSTPGLLMASIATREPPPLHDVRAEVPLDLSNAIARMMVKDRARRMASVRELGIVVERLISGGSDALPEPAPRRVPRAPNKLLGRESEMARLRAILQDPETRMVTLSGAGGSGKTRLALAVADATADLFPGGQVFVDLTAVTDHALVLSELARALGVEEDAERPLVTLIAAALGAQPSLIVLDNFEQVLGATPDVTRLSSLAPRARILVTSRFLLRVAAEQDFPVLPLPTPGAGESALLDNPAVALFLERARARQPGFTVDARELRAVAEICRRLDGLPLAIELAAARARVLRPTALLAHLERPLELLGGDAADRVPHQRTLLGTINWSLDLLQSEEREMFAALGVFAGGWSLDDVATVLASEGSGHEFAILVDRLQSLVERSLVTVRQVEGEVRYGMLETLRERARQLLGARADEGQLLMRHARHFADVAESAGAQLASHRQREAMARLGASHDNMRAALGWAERNDPGLLLRLAAALGQFWYLAGHWQEALSWYRRALAMDAGPSHQRASVLDEMGRLEMFLGDEAGATGHHREAHATALRTGDDDLCARTAEGLGEVLLKIGDIDQATSVLEDAERLARRAGHATPLAHALTTLATARVGSGAMRTASDLLREALRLAEPEGDAFLLVKIHYYLAGISLLEGELAESRRQCDAGRRAALDASDSSWSCHLEEMAARVSMEEGDLSLAAGLVEHSLTSFHDVGSRSCLPHSFEAVARWLLAARRGGDDVAVDAATRFVLGADTLCERLSITMLPVERALLAQTRARLEAASAKVGFPQRADPSWSEGAAALEALALLREGARVAHRA